MPTLAERLGDGVPDAAGVGAVEAPEEVVSPDEIGSPPEEGELPLPQEESATIARGMKEKKNGFMDSDFRFIFD